MRHVEMWSVCASRKTCSGLKDSVTKPCKFISRNHKQRVMLAKNEKMKRLKRMKRMKKEKMKNECCQDDSVNCSCFRKDRMSVCGQAEEEKQTTRKTAARKRLCLCTDVNVHVEYTLSHGKLKELTKNENEKNEKIRKK